MGQNKNLQKYLQNYLSVFPPSVIRMGASQITVSFCVTGWSAHTLVVLADEYNNLNSSVVVTHTTEFSRCFPIYCSAHKDHSCSNRVYYSDVQDSHISFIIVMDR